MKQSMLTLASPITREPRDRIQLARPGKFKHRKFGDFELTRDVFESFIDNFHLLPMSDPEIPIDYNHEFKEAGGWIKGLEVGDDGNLYANKVEWTPQAVEQIKSGQYKYLSMAFSRAGDDESGVPIGPELVAVSLTNLPFLKGMEPVSIELSDGSQVYELDLDSDDVAQFAVLQAKERNALPKSSFAYVDSEGVGHLPIHDEAHVRAAMARLNQTNIPDAAKRSAARKIVARARRMGIDVSEDFLDQWGISGGSEKSESKPDSEGSSMKMSAVQTAGSNGVVTINLNVTGLGGEGEAKEEPTGEGATTSEKPPVVEEKAKTEEGEGEPKTEERGEQMLEARIREVLKLSDKDSIEDALSAVQKTRELISGQGENAVVTYFDYTMLEQKSIKLERLVAEKDVEINKLKEKHEDDIKLRDAEDLVNKAITDGRVTPAMKKEWALMMAKRSPEEFKRVLASLPRMVRLQEEGSSEDVVVMSATKQFQHAMDELRDEHRKKDPNKVPSLGELQREVAARDPKLYAEYMDEVRIR